MTHQDTYRPRPRFGYVRTLSQQEELPLLRDHLLRLDPESRHDRFNGFLDDSFIERYAARCAADGTIIVAYMEDGIVRGAAELHPPEHSEDSVPEIAFSVEARVRRQVSAAFCSADCFRKRAGGAIAGCGSRQARRTRR
jgi:hypothetical protein